MSPVAPRLIENGHVAVKQCRHGIFAYNVNDTFIGRSLDQYGEWSESELAILFQVLQPGGVVIDAGANIGTHTVAFAKRVTASGLVIAFEPQRLTYQLLCANIALNALVNVRAINAAVSDAVGHVKIPALNPAIENNFGGMRAIGHEQGERVDTLRIDDVQMPRCSMIKIDVEGLEARVLAGARQTIAAHRPVLFVENNSEEGSPAILKALDELNYTCFWHFADYYNPQNFFGTAERIFGSAYRESNVLAFPREANVNVNLWPVNGGDDTPLKAYRRHS
jgi:FkbM family methyltransferase